LQLHLYSCAQDLLYLPEAHQSLHYREGSWCETQSEENYIFVLNKSNHKNRILRFLKLYDELTKCADEDVIVGVVRNWSRVSSLPLCKSRPKKYLRPIKTRSWRPPTFLKREG
jgi:hypothetical protein